MTPKVSTFVEAVYKSLHSTDQLAYEVERLRAREALVDSLYRTNIRILNEALVDLPPLVSLPRLQPLPVRFPAIARHARDWLTGQLTARKVPRHVGAPSIRPESLGVVAGTSELAGVYCASPTCVVRHGGRSA